MLCEKCKEKSATVHITEKDRGNTGVALNAEADHHFCEACGREFMQNNRDWKVASSSKVYMEFASSPNPNPFPPEPKIDISKQYDVYCMEPKGQLVVYRKARFKGAASLLPPPGGRMGYPGYIELEQANGQSIFIPRTSIFRFCEPGTVLVGEAVVPEQPEGH